MPGASQGRRGGGVRRRRIRRERGMGVLRHGALPSLSDPTVYPVLTGGATSVRPDDVAGPDPLHRVARRPRVSGVPHPHARV